MEDINELINCSICMETFTDPRQLECQHNFCCQCLTDYIDGKRENIPYLHSFDCPLCRRSISLSSANSNGESFPICLNVASLLNIVNKSPQQESHTQKTGIGCHKSCQALPTLKSSFTQTDIKLTKQQSVQASTNVKTFNTRTQTTYEEFMHVRKSCKKTQTTALFSPRRHSSKLQVEMKQKYTQTNVEMKQKYTQTVKLCKETRLPVNEISDFPRPTLIQIFHFVGDKWDLVFNRKFDNILEKLIIHYIILTISGVDRASGGLAFCFAYIICILCSFCYIILMIILCYAYSGQGYLFILIVLLYKLLHHVLTIDLNAHQGYVKTKIHKINVLFLHVVWFWTTVFCLCLLLYIICLLISVRGHPSHKEVCIYNMYENNYESQTVVMDYPDISFLMRHTKLKFKIYLMDVLNLDFSRISIELYYYVIKGEKIITTYNCHNIRQKL